MTEFLPGQRVDKWLWFARFAKTRSVAQKMLAGGKVRINREKVRSATRQVRPEDVLTISTAHGVHLVKVVGFSQSRVGFSSVDNLYQRLDAENLDENTGRTASN